MARLEVVRFFVPLFSLGTLFTALLVFGLPARDRRGTQLYSGVVLVLSLALIATVLEVTYLYYGEVLGRIALGMELTRLYELSVGVFMAGLPFFLSAIMPAGSMERFVARFNTWIMCLAVVGMGVIAFAVPDLFVSVTEVHTPQPGGRMSTVARGVVGPVFQIRDALLGLQMLVALALAVSATFNGRIRGARIWVVVGVVAGSLSAAGALYANFLGSYPGPFRDIPFSRVGLAFTVFAVFATFGYVVEYVQQSRLLDATNRELQHRRDRLAFLAYHDELTQMLNKQALVRDIQALVTGEPTGAPRGHALLCDLDGFRSVVDSFGFGFSDRLLRAVGKRLEDLAARHAGSDGRAYHVSADQFGVVLGAPLSEERLEAFEAEVLSTIAEPFSLDDRQVYLSTSAGQYTVDGSEADADEVFRRLKRALGEAQRHHNTVRRYSSEVHVAVESTQLLVQQLHRATREGAFEVHYQPILDRAGRVVAAEALMRWEVASPDRFIPVAEDSGLIVPMTDELISMVCRDVPRLRAVVPELTIFINISARHIGKLDLVSRLTHHLGGCNFDSSVLGVEITETSFFSNDSLVPGVIRELSEAGFSVAIDDFGTGYSSLSYLKRLQVDRIKIDRSFVADLPGSHADGALVDSVVTLGRRLNKIVVAEGVETEEQHRYLLAKGADFFQGYYFSPAIPAEKFTAGVAAARELDT